MFTITVKKNLELICDGNSMSAGGWNVKKQRNYKGKRHRGETHRKRLRKTGPEDGNGDNIRLVDRRTDGDGQRRRGKACSGTTKIHNRIVPRNTIPPNKQNHISKKNKSEITTSIFSCNYWGKLTPRWGMVHEIRWDRRQIWRFQHIPVGNPWYPRESNIAASSMSLVCPMEWIHPFLAMTCAQRECVDGVGSIMWRLIIGVTLHLKNVVSCLLSVKICTYK